MKEPSYNSAAPLLNHIELPQKISFSSAFLFFCLGLIVALIVWSAQSDMEVTVE